MKTNSPPTEQEVVDIYDRERNRTEQCKYRRNQLGQEEYELSSHVLICSPCGQLLMQRRAKCLSYPGMWDCGATGYVQSGESSVQAAIREVQEELGIDLNEQLQSQKPIQITCKQLHIDLFLVIWNGVFDYVNCPKFNSEVEQVELLHYREYRKRIENQERDYFYADPNESGYIKIFQLIESQLGLELNNIHGHGDCDNYGTDL
jgi:isopentenyldiphosphate isomerase